jgi:hypothetical protein
VPLRWDHQKAGVRRLDRMVFALLTSEFLATRFALSFVPQGVVFVCCSKNRCWFSDICI